MGAGARATGARVGWLVVAAAACALLLALIAASDASATGLFSTVPGTMFEGRYTPAAAQLPNGKVLIAGGFGEGVGSNPLKSAETYDPATGKFERLKAEENVAHGEQATVSLPGGNVLLVGGWSPVTKVLKTAEIFNAGTGTFEKVAAEMTVPRDGPGAVLLPTGKVLIIGGSSISPEPEPRTAELFDPATRTFSSAPGTMGIPRYQPVVAMLPNGKVLVAGGYYNNETSKTTEYVKTAELYDPSAGRFEPLTGAGHEPLERRDEAGGVTLQNGKVLIAGGFNGKVALASAETFDASTNTFKMLPDMFNEARTGDTGVLLADGRSLFVSGYEEKEPVGHKYPATIEIAGVPKPSATTGAASGVGISSAALSGSALTESATTVYFQYGPSTAYGAATPHQAIGFTGAAQALSAAVSGLAPATTYHFRLVAENAGGVSFGSDQSFTTAPPVPVVASVKQLRSRWREGKGLAQISRRTPVGTAFTFTLNTPAAVTFAFTQPAAGRKVHGRCVAPTRGNRRTRTCRRTVTRGTLAFNGHAGTNTVKFQGRITSRQKLRPGTYTLVISATGPSGAAAQQRLTFTIVG